MGTESYARAWSQLSDSGRLELTELANRTGPAEVLDGLRRELLALLPDAIEWRTWQPASNGHHQTCVDARFLDWVRGEASPRP
jgi:hypothetical protein